MIIYLIRHGRQSSQDCNVNVPLSEEGRIQSRLLGERMKSYKLDVIYSSTLVRAVETARTAFAYNKELLENLQLRQGLEEIDFGILTGQKDEEVKKFYNEYYQEQLDNFMEGRVQQGTALEEVNAFIGDFFVPPEEMWYPEGENGAMVLERVMPVVKEWIESGKKNIAVVTHGGLIRTLLCSLFGGDFARRLMFGTSLENCSITQLHYDEAKNGFFLDRFNDYAHIEGQPGLLRKNLSKCCTK